MSNCLKNFYLFIFLLVILILSSCSNILDDNISDKDGSVNKIETSQAFIDIENTYQFELEHFDEAGFFVSADSEGNICYFGDFLQEELKNTNVYYYSEEKLELIGNITRPKNIFSYDYVLMKDGTFYRIFDNGESSNNFYLVAVNPQNKMVRETCLNFEGIDNIYPFFTYAELDQYNFAIWVKHSNSDKNLYYNSILKYNTQTEKLSVMLEFTVNESENTRYIYGISSDEKYFYMLTSVLKNNEEVYYIQKYNFDGQLLQEFLVPNLLQETKRDFIQYFDCAENTFFIKTLSAGILRVYQLQNDELVKIEFGSISDGRYIWEGKDTKINLDNMYTLSIIHSKLLYNDKFPYIYLVTDSPQPDLYIFDPNSNQIYYVSFFKDEVNINNTVKLLPNENGDILLSCWGLNDDGTNLQKNYLIKAADIIKNMKLYQP